VVYESRLELAVLLLADFDPSVYGIVSQPFLLHAAVDGVPRKHIPDYLLLTGSGPVVVDVKPRRRLARPEVAQTFGWTRTLVEARGWRYEVRCEPPPGTAGLLHLLWAGDFTVNLDRPLSGSHVLRARR
jgi:hypothetical protein